MIKSIFQYYYLFSKLFFSLFRKEIEQYEINFSMEKEKLEIEKTLLEIEKNKLKDEREELNHLRDLFQLKESLKF